MEDSLSDKDLVEASNVSRDLFLTHGDKLHNRLRFYVVKMEWELRHLRDRETRHRAAGFQMRILETENNRLRERVAELEKMLGEGRK